jgi:hypothetical protein
VIAYKFLRAGGIGRFSGFQWLPEAEVEAEGPLELCANGVHACLPSQLAYWLDDELWTIELGEVAEEESVLVARQARLLDRVGGWPDAAGAFARAAADSVAARADGLRNDERLREYAADAAAFAERGGVRGAALAAYAAAVAADLVEPDGFVAERRKQGEWLATRLGLDWGGGL